MNRLLPFRPWALLLMGLLLAGCATPYTRQDPLEPLNRAVFGFNEAVDKAVLKPVAKGYVAAIPDPLRVVVKNFFSNLDDVVIVVNDLLQVKFKQAVSDAGRVLVNSTVGLLGIADVATPIGLEKHNEDFGQTLGRYGIGSGPYLVLPILGPSSVRDTVGVAVDRHVDPLFRIDHIPTRNTALAVKFVDARARLLGTEKVLEEAALDKYEFVRDAYLQRRRNLIYDGKPPAEEEDDGTTDAGKRSAAVPPQVPDVSAKAGLAAAPVQEIAADSVMAAPRAPAADAIAPAPGASPVSVLPANVFEPVINPAFPDEPPLASAPAVIKIWLPTQGYSN